MNHNLSYCTNVHAGTTLAECMANLDRHAVAVKARFSPDAAMGVGLWLSADAAREAAAGDGGRILRDFLAQKGLWTQTFNGFPFGNFHAQQVKHAVYRPTWAQDDRLSYTLDLAEILAQILPEGGIGSISTLPLGWPPADMAACGANLRRLAVGLARLHDRTGRLIRAAIEPEPGCALDTACGLAGFFREHLFTGPDEAQARSYVGVCHDVCHSAVMFEPQAFALDAYADAGIQLAKVQLSSAVSADFSTRRPDTRENMRRQLAAFAEDRYLHQTMVQDSAGTRHFFEDLPLALAAAEDPRIATGSWRVHFHVPLFLPAIGLLNTTQDEVTQCLQWLRCRGDHAGCGTSLSRAPRPHLEVETYAWGVLPPHLRPACLADGIAKEMTWAQSQPN